MKDNRIRKWHLVIVCMCILGVGVLGISQRSEAAHVNLDIGVGLPFPGVVAAPPVVVAPPYVAAAPPVVVEPAPVVVAPAYGPYYYRPYWHHRHHRYYRPYPGYYYYR